MSKLVLITPEGRIMTDEETLPTYVLETPEEIPLHVIAARQHAKDSTHKSTKNESD